MTDVPHKLLDEVHDRFFSAYDTFGKRKPVYKVDKPPYDVTVSFLHPPSALPTDFVLKSANHTPDTE